VWEVLVKFKILVLLLGITVLPACSFLSSKEVNRAPTQANLLIKCPEELPAVTGITGKDLLQSLLEDSDLYNECSARHNALVDALEEKEK
jgi:hypothetical protein